MKLLAFSMGGLAARRPFGSEVALAIGGSGAGAKPDPAFTIIGGDGGVVEGDGEAVEEVDAGYDLLSPVSVKDSLKMSWCDDDRSSRSEGSVVRSVFTEEIGARRTRSEGAKLPRPTACCGTGTGRLPPGDRPSCGLDMTLSH